MYDVRSAFECQLTGLLLPCKWKLTAAFLPYKECLKPIFAQGISNGSLHMYSPAAIATVDAPLNVAFMFVSGTTSAALACSPKNTSESTRGVSPNVFENRRRPDVPHRGGPIISRNVWLFALASRSGKTNLRSVGSTGLPCG